MGRRVTGFAGPTLLVLALAAPAFAQSASALTGAVRDETAGVLPGVTVSIRCPGAAVGTAVTDSRGEYEVAALPAGECQLEVVLPGFRSYVGAVTLAPGERRALDVVLKIAPLAETVTVTRTAEDLSVVPNAVSVVDQNAIQFAQRQLSPSEALIAIPGVSAENGYDFSIRGGVRLVIRAPLSANMRSVQIIQDGVPLTTADGTTQPNNMDLGSEGRIEVRRG